MYRARGNLSSGGYIFLEETLSDCAPRLPRDTRLRQFIGSRRTRECTARTRNQYREYLSRIILRLDSRLQYLLRRSVLFINTFVETVFDLVSWESVLFLLSLTRTVMIVDDNVSSIDITIIYIYIYIYLECL